MTSGDAGSMPNRCATALLALWSVVALAGCSATEDWVPSPDADLDLSAYPPCVEQPDPPELRDVPGLVLPDAATTFSLQAVGPLTQAEGMMDMTPLQARDFYEFHPDLDVLTVEDARVETEVLVTDGTHRMFVKVQITCAGGSNFTATVGAESASEMVPTPAGGSGGS